MSYRRDISSGLKLLALLLVLFVVYQTWLKAAWFAPGQEFERRSSTGPPPPSPAVGLPDTRRNSLWDVPPSRMMEFGPAPNPSLNVIRDELDRGDYDKVERRLRTLSQKNLTNISTRRFVAALWNNLGVQQEKFGGTLLSIKAFKQSVTWDPKSPLAHLNLTQAYWELHDPGMTPQFLENVIRLTPQETFPHLALTDLLLSQGNTVEASRHLEHVRERAVRDPNHQSYFRKLMAKLEAIGSGSTATSVIVPPPRAIRPAIERSSPSLAIHRSPSLPEPTRQTRRTDQPSSSIPPGQSIEPSVVHFTVQFDGPPDQAAWTRMHAILEYAYEELSQKFGHVPSKPIAVVLHTNQNFLSTSHSPQWADTLFDRSTGTIHLPTQGALEDLALFSRIARHEFVHTLLFDYSKGNISAVPGWLVEGLAIQLAEDPWPDVEKERQKTVPIIPLTLLQEDWKNISSDAMPIAYFESRSATQNLVDRYSMYEVRQIMNLLRGGVSLDAAMQQKLSVSYEQFRRQWEETYRSSITSSG